MGTNEGFSLEDAEEQKWMWKYGWIFEDQVVDKNEDCGGRFPPGRKDRAIRTAGSGVEYRDNGWKWKAWSTVERCREARRRQSGCSDRCEATKSQ